MGRVTSFQRDLWGPVKNLEDPVRGPQGRHEVTKQGGHEHEALGKKAGVRM